MITVKLFGTFRLDSGIKELQMDAKTVKDIYPVVMEEVLKKNPNTTLSMADVKGCIVSIDGKQVGVRAKVKDGDVVYLVPAVAGG